jgi:hypothetical protein
LSSFLCAFFQRRFIREPTNCSVEVVLWYLNPLVLIYRETFMHVNLQIVLCVSGILKRLVCFILQKPHSCNVNSNLQIVRGGVWYLEPTLVSIYRETFHACTGIPLNCSEVVSGILN